MVLYFMNRKFSFLALILLTQSLAGSAYAEANAASPSPILNAFQFYLGATGGMERMSGKRSDSLNEADAGGDRITTVYVDNRRMFENNPTLSAMTGVLWKIPSLPVLIGPELFLGRGATLSSVKDTRLDLVPETRFYTTDFQRKLFYGALVRLGYQFCTDYLTYLSVGYDRSQFLISRAITNDQVNQPTTMTQYTKWFNGFLLGLGLEKKIASLIVGVDLRMVKYRRRKFVDNMNVPQGIGPGFLSFSVRPIIYTVGLRLSYQF